MNTKLRKVLIVSLALFMLGLLMLAVSLDVIDHELLRAALAVLGGLIALTGLITIVSSYFRAGKIKSAVDTVAALSVQAQAEYSKRLAEFSRDGAGADEITQAKLFAQAVQLMVLKAPATAVFAGLNETTAAEENGVYTVAGWVDAQNSYAAMIRTPFTMIVSKKDGVWQTGSTFISEEAAVNSKTASNFLAYLIFAVIATIVIYYIMQTLIGF